MSKYVFLLILMCCLLCMPSITIAEQMQPTLKGKLLYLKNKEVWTYDPISENHNQLTNNHKITNYNVSSDGKILIYVSSHKLFLKHLATNENVFITNIEPDMSSPSLSPDNNTLIYASKSEKEYQLTKYLKSKVRHLWAIDIRTKKKLDITKGSAYECTAANYSPNGKYISFASTQGKNWNVHLMSSDYTNDTILYQGINSDWIQNDTLSIGDFDKATIYDVKKNKVIREIKVDSRFHPAKFSFTNEGNVYYEESADGPDISISYMNVANGQIKKIVTDARAPKFVK